MKLNRILAIVTVILFIISFLAYRSSIAQAERFERGQKFLPNLNPDKIAEIVVDKGDDHVALKREEDHFKLVNKNGFPAKNQAVNRLISGILDMELEKEIGTSKDLSDELDTNAEGKDSTHIVLKNDAGKEMVNFFIGKNAEGGQGSFVRKSGDGQMAYLTNKSVYLTTSPTGYIKDEILDVKEDQVEKVEGNGLVISEKDGKLDLQGVPKGKEVKSSELSQVKGALAGLKAKDVFLADDPEVQGLDFKSGFNVYLKDKTYYQTMVAKKGDRMFLKVVGGHNLNPIKLTGQETEDEMKEKSKVLQRADEIKKFNDFNGSWVYELNEYGGKKFFYTKNDLLQDKTKS